jgi:excisionase family DNA binding protein
MDETIYTIPEVAQYLKISKTKLYDWVQQGKIPHVKIGRNLRIRESDLKRFIEANTITVKTPDGYTGRFHLLGD